MARRRRKGRKAGFLSMPRKILRMGVNILFKVAGAAVATSPLHRGIRDAAGGNFQQAVLSWQQDTVGDPKAPDISKIAGTVVTVGVGLLIAWIGGQVSRRI